MKKELIVGLLGISLAAMPLTAFANDEVTVISANDTAATIQENIATQCRLPSKPLTARLS